MSEDREPGTIFPFARGLDMDPGSGAGVTTRDYPMAVLKGGKPSAGTVGVAPGIALLAADKANESARPQRSG